MRLILFLAISWTALAQTYMISTFAGGPPQTNVLGTAAALGEAFSVATDSSGNVYFSTQDSVQRLDASSGLVTLVAGNGTVGFSGDNGPATGAQLNDPNGLAVDSAGNLYISDGLNNRIREVSNGIIKTVAGGGFGGDNGPAIGAGLNHPNGVAVDSSGNIYIADGFNYRIREVSNGVITTIDGTGTYGSITNEGPALSSNITVPTGIAVDSAGNVYFVDYYVYKIRVISNGFMSTVAGNGSFGFNGNNIFATSAALTAISGIAVDAAGNLYIADTFNNRIRKVSNGIMTTIAGNGIPGFTGDNGPALNAELDYPLGVSVDPAGSVYIADNADSRIRKVANGVITSVAGNPAYASNGDNGPAATAQLAQPYGIALDSAGNAYISKDEDNHVREVSGGIITTVAGSALSGFFGDNGPATSASLDMLFGVAVDSAGNLYIADGGNDRIRKVSDGSIMTVAGFGQTGDGGGYNGDNIPATTAQLNYPHGVAVDSAGNLYIADTSNERIRKVSVTGVITTVAGNGNPGYTGDNGPATNAELYSPTAVAVDSSGNLYIADEGNSVIRKVSNGVITTIAGNGTAGFTGDNVPATSTRLNYPNGVAVDSAGTVYIADTNNARIRIVSGGLIATIAGNGTAGFSGDTGPAMNAELSKPTSVAVDSAGNVYVADENNNRIRLLTPAIQPSCSYTLTPASLQSPAAGGSFNVAIQTAATCPWTISGLPNWITVSGANSGTGPASVTLVLAPNTSNAPLNATISIAGISVIIAEAINSQTTGPSITSNGVTNAASFQTGIVPGSIITIFCSNLGVPAGQTLTASGNTWPPQIGGISVYMNGLTAPVYSVLNQNGYQLVSVQAPWELATATSATVTVVTGAGASMSPPVTVPVLLAQPGIFLLDGASSGATHLDGSLVNVSNPAAPGESVVLYLTGLGEVYHQPATGTAASLTTLSRTVLLPQVTMGGAVTATPVFSGLAPGDIGTYQIDVTVPTTGLSGLLNLTVQMNGVTSNIATIAVQ